MKKRFIGAILGATMILSSAAVFANEAEIKPEIKFLQENGYLKGRENGLELESLVTRAEALTMLLRISDEENIALYGETTNESESVVTYEVIAGTFVKNEENGIIINTENGEVLINTENALLRGTNVEEAKEGNIVSAVVSTQMTRSIPAQTKGYAVVISEMTSVKAIEVADVEEEDDVYNIVSSDGEYVVVASKETPVTPFATRNIMSIEDISKGDKIFVFTDVMTMSIPAQIMPNEIVVYENAFEEEKTESGLREDKDFKDTVGHWAEKIIKYSYVNGYVDGDTENTFNPEGNVKGREFVKMMLSKLGEEEITIETAYDCAKDTGFVDDEALDVVIKENKELSREDISKLCFKFIKMTKPDEVIGY